MPKWGAHSLYQNEKTLTKSCLRAKLNIQRRGKKEKYLCKGFPEDMKKDKKSPFISRNHKAKFKYTLQFINVA